MIKINKKYLLIFILFNLCISSLCAKEKYNLKLDLKPGDEYNYDTFTVSTSNNKLDETHVTLSNVIDTKSKFKVLEKIDNKYKIEMTLLYLGIHNSSPAGETNHSSDKDSIEENADDFMSLVLSRVVNIPINILLSDNGKVLYIDSIDNKINNLFEDMPFQSKEIIDILNKSTLELIGQNAKIKEIENSFSYIPIKEVNLNEEWQNITNIESIINFKVNNKYKINKSDKKGINIKYSAKLESETSKPQKINNMEITYNLKGKSEGTLTIDMETKWLVNSIFKQNVVGEGLIKSENLELNGKILLIDQETSIRTFVKKLNK